MPRTKKAKQMTRILLTAPLLSSLSGVHATTLYRWQRANGKWSPSTYAFTNGWYVRSDDLLVALMEDAEYRDCPERSQTHHRLRKVLKERADELLELGVRVQIGTGWSMNLHWTAAEAAQT